MVAASIPSLCLSVCLRTFSRAVLTSATRAVSRTLQVEQSDLDPSGPYGSWPFAFDEDTEGPSMSMGDLSVSDISLPASSLPPALRTPSAKRRFRQEVRDALQSLFALSAAPGTVRTYETPLRAIAPKVAAKLSSRALPMDSESASYALSGAAAVLGPGPSSSVTGQHAVRWSYVKLVEAAVAFCHVASGMRAVFDTD